MTDAVLGAADRSVSPLGAGVPDRPGRDEPVHRLVVAVFQALDAGGVRWALLRGAGRLSGRRGDIDLLVDPADLPVVRRLVAPIGWGEVPAPGHGSHLFFLGYDAAQDLWLRLDVVSTLAFGRHQELRALAASEALARRRTGTFAWGLEASDAFWALVLHHALDRAPLDAEKRVDLRAAARRAELGGPVAERVVATVGLVLTERLYRAARGDSQVDLDEAMAQVERVWRRRAGWRPVLLRTADRVSGRLSRVLPGRRGPGLTVAILGPDGAGKSTLVAALVAQLPWGTRTYYMGVLRTRPMARRLRAVPGLMLVVRLVAFRGRCALAAHHRRRGQVVLFDRYSYDALLPVARSSLRGRASAALILALCPPPDATVLLDCPAEVMWARKQELGLARLADFRQRYLAIAAGLPDVLVVDATLPRAVVRRQVTEMLWMRLRQGTPP